DACRRQAGGFAGNPADQVRADHQLEDREGAGAHHPAHAARPRRRGDRMKRRDFLSAVGGLLAASAGARAQTTAKATRTIGVLTLAVSPSSAMFESFLKGLRELGYEVGKNVVIEFRHADGRADRLPPLAAALAARKVDV